MNKWIIGVCLSVMFAGCAPNFEADLTSLEHSFEAQRAAVADNDGKAFIRSLEQMSRLMKSTMKAVDKLPVAEQMPAALRFVQVGDQGEKLYYSNDFRQFMDGEIQSSGEAARVKSVFNRLKALNLRGWLDSKKSTTE